MEEKKIKVDFDKEKVLKDIHLIYSSKQDNKRHLVRKYVMDLDLNELVKCIDDIGRKRKEIKQKIKDLEEELESSIYRTLCWDLCIKPIDE